MMAVHPEHADPNCKQSRMTFRACVKLPLYVYGIEAIINTPMPKTPQDILVHLAALENGINPKISTLKKEKGDLFS